jgi:ribosome biogenesis SPOUT family RNA methylase Rps3
MTDILDALCDLRKQATEERSHFYVRKCVDDAVNEIERLRRRVVVLEMVIREDLHPEDCSDEANQMIVEGVHKMKLSFAERHPNKTTWPAA